MNLKLEIELSKADILREADDFKKQIDNMRPLPTDLEGKVMQKLRLDWNYHSNAIEGNRLNYGETVAFLMEGITAKGKPLKDHLDIRGHNEAINFLLEIVKDTRPLSEADVRSLHKMILVEPYKVPARTADGFPTQKQIALGEYKTQPNHVQTATGETHYYASPEETPAKMQELMEWYAAVTANPELHPVVATALFHHKFVAIHPFDDGNGRLSRILMNLVLMQNGYPPVVIKLDNRQNYYALLSRADNGDSWPFVEYIVERLLSSMQLFLKAASGGDINEDEDIDKEIALLDLELKGNATAEIFRSDKVIFELLKTQIIPFSLRIANKLQPFEKSFFNIERSLTIVTIYNGHPIFNGDVQQYEVSLSDRIDIESWLCRIDLKVEEYQSVCLYLRFNDYKGPINPFDVHCDINFIFHDYTYELVYSNNKAALSKLYHEVLNDDDYKLIIAAFIAQFKRSLSKKADQ